MKRLLFLLAIIILVVNMRADNYFLFKKDAQNHIIIFKPVGVDTFKECYDLTKEEQEALKSPGVLIPSNYYVRELSRTDFFHVSKIEVPSYGIIYDSASNKLLRFDYKILIKTHPEVVSKKEYFNWPVVFLLLGFLFSIIDFYFINFFKKNINVRIGRLSFVIENPCYEDNRPYVMESNLFSFMTFLFLITFFSSFFIGLIGNGLLTKFLLIILSSSDLSLINIMLFAIVFLVYSFGYYCDNKWNYIPLWVFSLYILFF